MIQEWESFASLFQLFAQTAYKLDFQGVQWFQPPVHRQSCGVKGLIILELPVSTDLFTCKTLWTSGGQISWPLHFPSLPLLSSLHWRNLAAQMALGAFGNLVCGAVVTGLDNKENPTLPEEFLLIFNSPWAGLAPSRGRGCSVVWGRWSKKLTPANLLLLNSRMQ